MTDASGAEEHDVGEELDVARLRDQARIIASRHQPEAPDGVAAQAVRLGVVAGLGVAAVATVCDQEVLGAPTWVAGVIGLFALAGVAMLVGALTSRGGRSRDPVRDAAVAGVVAGLCAAFVWVPPAVTLPVARAAAAEQAEKLSMLAWMVGATPWITVASAAGAALVGGGAGQLAGRAALVAEPEHPAPLEGVGTWHGAVAVVTGLPVIVAVWIASLVALLETADDTWQWVLRVGPAPGTLAATGVAVALGMGAALGGYGVTLLFGVARGATRDRDGAVAARRWLFWTLLGVSLLGPALVLGAALAWLRARVVAGVPWESLVVVALVAVCIGLFASSRARSESPTTPDPPLGVHADGALIGGLAAQLGAGLPVTLWVGAGMALLGASPSTWAVTWSVAAVMIGVPWLSWAWWATTVDALAWWAWAPRASDG